MTRARRANSTITKTKHERVMSGVDARAQMRVLIAGETGKSPFDSSVVREARRRVAKQLDIDIAQAIRDPLQIMLNALPAVHGKGRVGDRKIFIAALWDVIGDEINMTLSEFKRWLIDQHRHRNIVLARADLIAAMPYELVMRSEANTEGSYSGATFHFIIDQAI
jgi:hypothetical protein